MKRAVLAHIDHLVYAVSDLEQGIERLEVLTGVRPALGGEHQAWGTHNAILQLGDSEYLEVIAPNPRAPGIEVPRAFQGNGRLTAWAAKTSGIEQLLAIARRAWIELGEIHHGERLGDDGERLTWSLTDPAAVVFEGLVPFFIDWGDSAHPAASAPKGCILTKLTAHYPVPATLTAALADLGVEIDVQSGAVASLEAELQTPNGTVILR